MTISDNKRIAKNTLLLYFRMILTIVVGLYTSRVVLNTLGVSDYGVYNVVGGIVAMLSFLNSALTAASQRFIAFELGRGDIIKLRKIFCTSVTIHVTLAVIILVIAETIGLWFVNTHLNIEAERMVAANWVYQCSIFTFMLTVLSVPYNSCIVAHEHMNAFAYISILEVTLKLLIVYLLLVISFDKLITYGILVFSVALVVRLAYGIYCKRHFEECTYCFGFDKGLFNEMFSFAGWSVVGNLGFSFKDQLANIILNLFFGTVVNAARGVALQVNGIISGFSTNFMMALSPQITKEYAAGNTEKSISLVYAGCRYSFFLLLLMVAPVLVNVDYLLRLWLVVVPEYTSEFLCLALITALFYSMAPPLVTALQATGNVKVFQLTICIVMLCELPLAYAVLCLGGLPYMSMYPTVLVTLVGIFVRFVVLRRMVAGYSLRYFCFSIVGRNIVVCAISLILAYYVRSLFIAGFWSFVFTSVLSCLIVAVTVSYLGMSRNERQKVISKVSRYIRKLIYRKQQE